MWSSSEAQQMDTHAAHYQQALVMALGMEAKRRLNKGYHPLSDALAKIIGWRKRYLAANETDRQSRAMYMDWLQNVHASSDIYSDWLSAQLDRQYTAQPARERIG